MFIGDKYVSRFGSLSFFIQISAVILTENHAHYGITKTAHLNFVFAIKHIIVLNYNEYPLFIFLCCSFTRIKDDSLSQGVLQVQHIIKQVICITLVARMLFALKSYMEVQQDFSLCKTKLNQELYLHV